MRVSLCWKISRCFRLSSNPISCPARPALRQFPAICSTTRQNLFWRASVQRRWAGVGLEDSWCTHTCIDLNGNKSAPPLLQQRDAPQPHPLYFRGQELVHEWGQYSLLLMVAWSVLVRRHLRYKVRLCFQLSYSHICLWTLGNDQMIKTAVTGSQSRFPQPLRQAKEFRHLRGI